MQIKLGDLTEDERKIITKHLGDFITGDGKDAIFEAKTETELSGQQSALKKERKRADDAEKALKAFADLDPEEARDALDQVKGGKLKTDAEVQAAIKAARLEGAKAKETELKPTIETLTGEVNRHKLTEPVRRAALEAGVRGDRIDDVLALTSSRFKLDGDKVLVLDPQGEDTTATVADFFTKDYKTARPEFFNGSGKGGSGAHNDPNKGGGGKTYTRAQYNELAASNPTAAAAMMAEVTAKTATLTD